MLSMTSADPKSWMKYCQSDTNISTVCNKSRSLLVGKNLNAQQACVRTGLPTRRLPPGMNMIEILVDYSVKRNNPYQYFESNRVQREEFEIMRTLMR
jgi:hypothetical protein